VEERLNYTTLLNLATEIGFDLLQNGAEIYRVEDSVRRIFAAYGILNSDVFTIPSCILVTINDEAGCPLTRVRRLTASTTNIMRIERYNSLCRQICRSAPDFDWIRSELNRIDSLPCYSLFAQILATALISFSFTLFYGGDIWDALVAFVCGFILKPIFYAMQKFNSNSFFNNIICSALITLLATLAFHLSIASHYDKIIIGTLMNLVPGIAITNVMRDIIAGDLLSGTIKFIEALLVALGIALGAGLAITAMRLLSVL
jgi:uncharacterized membrane protein YjjP (DUF1212 family)